MLDCNGNIIKLLPQLKLIRIKTSGQFAGWQCKSQSNLVSTLEAKLSDDAQPRGHHWRQVCITSILIDSQ